MQKKKFIKPILYIVISLLFIASTVYVLGWNRNINKNSLFKKYIIENDKEIYVLGTIGKKHFKKINNYSMDDMLSVIENVNPELVMIQARDDHYLRYGIIDGNIDACVAYSFCAENEIVTSLIDWWVIDNNYAKSSSLNLRDDNIFIRASRNIKEAPPKSKILIILSSYNFYEQIERFKIAGYKEVEIENKNQYFNGKNEKFKFPAIVAKSWRDRTYYFAYSFPTEVKNTKGIKQEIVDKFINANHDKFYLEEIQYCKYLNNDILFKY